MYICFHTKVLGNVCEFLEMKIFIKSSCLMSVLSFCNVFFVCSFTYHVFIHFHVYTRVDFHIMFSHTCIFRDVRELPEVSHLFAQFFEGCLFISQCVRVLLFLTHYIFRRFYVMFSYIVVWRRLRIARSKASYRTAAEGDALLPRWCPIAGLYVCECVWACVGV